jgi:hypothetical protein
MEISREQLEKMFKHYVERKRYNQSCIPRSYEDTYSYGECAECENWLKLFGVDVSYEIVQPMIDGRTEICMRLLED